MIKTSEIQHVYIDLYKEMRRYIWNFKVVENLAKLEVSVYEACPDIFDIRNKFSVLRSSVLDVISKDEELRSAFDKFFDVISSEDEVGYKLYYVNEVFPQ